MASFWLLFFGSGGGGLGNVLCFWGVVVDLVLFFWVCNFFFYIGKLVGGLIFWVWTFGMFFFFYRPTWRHVFSSVKILDGI